MDRLPLPLQWIDDGHLGRFRWCRARGTLRLGLSQTVLIRGAVSGSVVLPAGHDALLVFVTDREVPFKNNESECAVWPSVIFRKVTTGWRSQWGADSFAAVRSVTDAGRLNGPSSFGAALQSIQGQSIPVPLVSSYGS